MIAASLLGRVLRQGTPVSSDGLFGRPGGWAPCGRRQVLPYIPLRRSPLPKAHLGILLLLLSRLLLNPQRRLLGRLRSPRSPRSPLPSLPLRSLNLCALLLLGDTIERQLKLLQRRTVVCELSAAAAGLRRRRRSPRLRLAGLGAATPGRGDFPHAPLPHLLERNLACDSRARGRGLGGVAWVCREVVPRLVPRRSVLRLPRPVHRDDGRRGGRAGGPRGGDGCCRRGVRVGRAAVAEPPGAVAQRRGARHLGHGRRRRGVELKVPGVVSRAGPAVSSPVGDVGRVVGGVGLVRGRAWS